MSWSLECIAIEDIIRAVLFDSDTGPTLFLIFIPVYSVLILTFHQFKNVDHHPLS